jgi:mRNA-degrading endonuclease RelE of RelBE toxin-antitoxin system|tara:strand:+ start:11675 stop:11917 length:243 start_codon:yes stop_codon:yes gene_type:complete
MVKVTRLPEFIKQTKHLDNFLLKKLRLQILKILDDPNIGKPLKYKRGERSLYIRPFRLIYSVREEEIILLKFEHRKNVYK